MQASERSQALLYAVVTAGEAQARRRCALLALCRLRIAARTTRGSGALFFVFAVGEIFDKLASRYRIRLDDEVIRDGERADGV